MSLFLNYNRFYYFKLSSFNLIILTQAKILKIRFLNKNQEFP